jgi:hypothetical protein
MVPKDKKLYEKVKRMADKQFESKTGIYRSSWIVREYKKRGGEYIGNKPKMSGLKRWYKEEWVDLNRPIKKNNKIIGYEQCGRSQIKKGDKYPLCRPTHRVNSKTPKTYKELSIKSINKAKKEKSKVKGAKNIQFGGLKCENCKECNNKIEELNDKKFEEIKTLLMKKDKKEKQTGGDGCDISCMIGGKPQFYGKKSKKMIKVPKNVKKWALYAFKLKKIGFEGALETGWKRAKQLATQDNIPIEDLRYMRNWYARHIYTSYPGFKEWIDNGKPLDSKWHKKHAIQSWLTWGGNAGFNWVNSDKTIKMLNEYFNKEYKKIDNKIGGKFDKSKAKFPRKWSKEYCKKTSCDKMGFSQKSSCRYYKDCYSK